ncbi:hypothetical protein OH76DRAFT_1403903 [Lentinus brumalis]|uniref:Uncharacterized protein n=1 Tax=Lentinus brumalis TaxID=2498619 RepID=A0A371D9W3_9APHY|nr:hypothetical protein OH76DRAFT_1403903 [Polyporus brumalis]
MHYNISREAAQLPPHTPNLNDFVSQANEKAWNNSLTVITAPSVSFWYNFTGYSRVAVYGSINTWAGVPYTAWANYSIGGEYTAGNITGAPKVVTDYPLFVSSDLQPGKSYNLTVEVSASPDAPFVLDYVLGYQQPAPTPIGASSSSSSPGFPVGALVGGLVGSIALLIIFVAVLVYCLLRRQKRKLGWTVKPLDGEFSPITTSPNTSGSYMRDTSVSTSTVQSPPTPIHSRFTTGMSGHTSSRVDSRSRPDMSAHTRSSSQLPLLSSINSPPAPVTDPVGRPDVDVPQVEEPLYNPYELLPTQHVPSSSMVPASMAVTKLPAPVSTQAGTSAVIELGPNGYPIEKRRELRMEPAKKQRLYPANPDMVGSSSGGGNALKEGPSASPPAYDT